jgi:uncharacterized phage protein (TIGR01671 family)
MNNMSHIIKFRAWDPEEKKMYSPVDLFNMQNSSWEDSPDGSLRCCLILDATGNRRYLDLMLFTGVKDKVGNEIYEGDKVDFAFLSIFSGDESAPQRGVVTWNNRTASFEINLKDVGAAMDLSLPARFIKVGNIYE